VMMMVMINDERNTSKKLNVKGIRGRSQMSLPL